MYANRLGPVHYSTESGTLFNWVRYTIRLGPVHSVIGNYSVLVYYSLELQTLNCAVDSEVLKFKFFTLWETVKGSPLTSGDTPFYSLQWFNSWYSGFYPLYLC